MSSQKMECLLGKWALAMQEFNFVIKYHKDSQNYNTDALSWNTVPSPTITAVTQFVVDPIKKDTQQVQHTDPILQIVYETLQKSRDRPTTRQWRKPPLSCYCKLWSQLILHNGVLCWKYTWKTLGSVLIVPILPQHLQKQALYYNVMTVQQVVIKDLLKP